MFEKTVREKSASEANNSSKITPTNSSKKTPRKDNTIYGENSRIHTTYATKSPGRNVNNPQEKAASANKRVDNSSISYNGKNKKLPNTVVKLSPNTVVKNKALLFTNSKLAKVAAETIRKNTDQRKKNANLYNLYV